MTLIASLDLLVNTASTLLPEELTSAELTFSEADAGLIVETGDSDDARMFYDVSENFWSAGHGASYSQVIRLADAVSDGDATKGKVLKNVG